MLVLKLLNIQQYKLFLVNTFATKDLTDTSY